MKITIFGTWYVGLVTWTCLAEVGHEVMCIDIDEKKIENLKKWIIPFYEPWLQELVLRNYKEKRLHFSTNAKKWVEFGLAIFSAVWTPPDKNHRADLKYVKEVAKTVWKYMTKYKVFINKSTVPVWTWEICKKIIEEEINKSGQTHRSAPTKNNVGVNLCVHPNIEFDIVSNPEFLKEGAAIKDFMVPDRIICGVESEKAKEIMEKIYKTFTRTNKPLIFTDIKSAEIIKYAANSFLATKISFINEIANFAELAWANISDISKWIWLDPRIWAQFLHAGIGYWWSCFPKDVQALIETGKDFYYDFKIIKAVEEVNKVQKLRVVEKLKPHLTSPNRRGIIGNIISIWWLSFKPKTDDIRDAPSLEIIKKLLDLWVKEIKVFDPVAIENTKKYFWKNEKIKYYENNYEALKNSDALLILTEWDEFRNADFEKVKNLMNWKIIIDWRNIYDKKDIEKLGFIYEWIWKWN